MFKRAKKSFIRFIILIIFFPVVLFVTLPCLVLFLYLFKISCGAHTILKSEMTDNNPTAVRVVMILILAPIIYLSILMQYLFLLVYAFFCEWQQLTLSIISLFKITTFAPCSKETLLLYNSPNIAHNIYN